MSIFQDILQPLFKSQSLTDLENPAPWLWETGGAKRSTSGQLITASNSFTVSAYFAAVRNISEDIAKLPAPVIRKMQPRGRERLPNHRVTRLLNIRPNPDMTALSFKETLSHWAIGWGSGFAEIQRNGAGQPVNLWPIHPDRISPFFDKNENLMWKVIISETSRSMQSGDVKAVVIPDEDIFNLHGLGDGITGYSLLSFAAETLGIAIAAQKHAGSFFGNGASLSGALEHPGKLSKEARSNLKNSFNERHTGAENHYKIEVFEEGMKYKPTSISPQESQLLQSRMFSVEDIARWIRIPPHKIQHLERATFSNIEQQNIEYVTDALGTWIARWEAETKRKLLVQDDLFLKIETNALMRGDQAARVNYYNRMFNMGTLTPNQIRELEDMNPNEDPSGDEYYIQKNMSKLSAIAMEMVEEPLSNGQAEDDAESDTEEPQNAGMPEESNSFANSLEDKKIFIQDAFQTLIRKEVKAVTRAISKYAEGPELDQWFNRFYGEQFNFYLQKFTSLFSTIDCSLDLESFASLYIQHQKLHIISMLGDESKMVADYTEELISSLIELNEGRSDA